MKLSYLLSWLVSLFTITHSHAHALDIADMEKKESFLPYFNADSAYYFIQQQINFGPRVPNTEAHQHCKKFLKKQLQAYGAQVHMQEFQALSFENKTLQLCNIIASFNVHSKSRILLAAHWDTRPFADKDTNSQERPILGANDGASGVGILLEIARMINEMPLTNIGIDIIFFDGEDYGPTEECKNNFTNPALFWCLGSQYWSKHPHQPNYTAQYGILVDMVGNGKATFYQEAWSMLYSPKHVMRVWNIAQELGYGNYFISQPSGYHILDDHYFVNKYAHIPMINIIDHTTASQNCFGFYHHTHADNLDLISKETLQAVGQTVLQAIYTIPSE
ncbi:MAG: peptidase [Candidatus Amoebophilus sp. 36-38]|nr:MAG: peptidase [Candidatus Amoebophilus sp. 36-38]